MPHAKVATRRRSATATPAAPSPAPAAKQVKLAKPVKKTAKVESAPPAPAPAPTAAASPWPQVSHRESQREAKRNAVLQAAAQLFNERGFHATSLDDIAARLSLAQTDAQRFLKSGIATRNQRFNHMIAEIEQVAISSPSPILLNGATGAGKSMLAKRIYELKKARHLVSGRFVDVNCATLRGDMAAAALFGHGKGAFTGAANSRAGFLKSADLGVLFLDEIGELGMDEQAMLLKAIEEKEFFAMGSDTPSSSSRWAEGLA